MLGECFLIGNIDWIYRTTNFTMMFICLSINSECCGHVLLWNFQICYHQSIQKNYAIGRNYDETYVIELVLVLVPVLKVELAFFEHVILPDTSSTSNAKII